MADSDVDVRESSFTTFPAAEMEGELRTKDTSMHVLRVPLPLKEVLQV